jgi:hypothetical protein
LFTHSSLWYTSRAERFSDREELDFDELLKNFFSDFLNSRECVREALTVLETFYEIPIGKMRPTDSLEKFFELPEGGNILKNLGDSFLSSECESDFEDILESKMKGQSNWNHWKDLFYYQLEQFTLKEYVSAYCGKLPPNDEILK